MKVTFSAGSATTNNAVQLLGAGEERKITAGKERGALNVFISNDMRFVSGGASDTGSGESFINFGRETGGIAPREPDEGLLSHEIGHQFGYSAAVHGHASAEFLVNTANSSLRIGRTHLPESASGYGRNSTHIGRPGSGKRQEIPAISVYRNGAKRFEWRPRGLR